MKNTKAFLAIAAVVAFQASARADDATCPASKTEATAATAQCAAASQCSAAGARHVMLKVKDAECCAIEKALSSLEGVAKVETCSESKFTKVAYDGTKVCTDKILAALKDGGFKVEAQRVTFAVNDLACGACSTKVSKALAKVKGVSETKVCHESKQAVVDFDPNQVSSDKVLAAIDASGFKATEAVSTE